MKEINARFLLLGAALACAPCLLADASAAMAESWVGTLPATRLASGAEVPPLDVTGPRSVHVAGDFARFEHVWARLDRGEPVRIAVIGGSITQGAGASKPDRRWGETFCAGWRRAFPKAKIDFVNAGIGATGSDIGLTWLWLSSTSTTPTRASAPNRTRESCGSFSRLRATSR